MIKPETTIPDCPWCGHQLDDEATVNGLHKTCHIVMDTERMLEKHNTKALSKQEIA